MVDDRWDLAVGIDGQELRRELLAARDVDPDHLIWQRDFLEHDGDLAPVRRCPGIKVDHRRCLLVSGGAIAALLRNGADLLAQAFIRSHQSVEVTGGEPQQAAEAEGDDVGIARPILGIPVRESKAAVRFSSPNLFRPRGAMNPITRPIQTDPRGANRIVWPGRAS